MLALFIQEFVLLPNDSKLFPNNIFQEYLQRERYGPARLENFASGLELIGQKASLYLKILYFKMFHILFIPHCETLAKSSFTFYSKVDGKSCYFSEVRETEQVPIYLLVEVFNFFHSLNLLFYVFQLQMGTLQSRLDAEFLLAHMCSVKFKEWIVVLATLLRRSEVRWSSCSAKDNFCSTDQRKHELSVMSMLCF